MISPELELCVHQHFLLKDVHALQEELEAFAQQYEASQQECAQLSNQLAQAQAEQQQVPHRWNVTPKPLVLTAHRCRAWIAKLRRRCNLTHLDFIRLYVVYSCQSWHEKTTSSAHH